jgi:membrane fusion protein, copper/silver efflux system
MKKILSAVVIGLLMIVSYIAGRHHTGRPAAATANTRRVLYWVDPMHPQYKSDHPGIAPDCGMALAPVYAGDVGNTSQGALTASLGPLPPEDVSIDDAMQRRMGIRTAAVERSGATRVIRALGRVVPEDTRVYKIDSGSDGFIRETYNDSLGTLVKKDQKLAAYYGSEFLAVASGFLAATERVPGATGKDGSRTVPFPGAVSKQGVSSLQGYSDRLRNLGMSDVQIRQMAESRQLPESIDVVAPVDGFILARNITVGQHFDRSMELYRIADLSQVWILADVFGSEVEHVRPGALARVTLPDQGRTFLARVSQVLPQVDASTRTLKLRLEADNPSFALRPDMFVDVELKASVPPGLTVPRDAVIDSGRQQSVFVERSDGVFEPREVETGWHLGDRVEIVHGLEEGERVVAAGTFLVDSESRLKPVGQAPARQPELHEEAPRSNTEAMAVRAGKVNE